MSEQKMSRRSILTALGVAGAALATGQFIQVTSAQQGTVTGHMYGGGPGGLPEMLKKRVLALDSIADLNGYEGEYAGRQVHLIGYIPGTDTGGGIYYWDADCPKSAHNGGTIISPTVPFDMNNLSGFLQRAGETDPSGLGCWMATSRLLDVHTVSALIAGGRRETFHFEGETSISAEIFAKSSLNAWNAEIVQTAVDHSIVYYTGVPGPSYKEVVGFRLAQPDSSSPGGGTANNHASIKFGGGEFNRVMLNKVDTAALGISFGYGSIHLPRRRHEYGVAAFNSFRNIEKMAIENIGASYSMIVGNGVDGIRGNSHGIRLSGYGKPTDAADAECEGVVGAANVIRGMQTGVSMQNTAKGFNLSALYMENVGYAVHAIKGTSQANNPTLGRVDFSSKNVGRGIWSQGASYTTYDFTINGTSEGAGVEELTESSAEGHNVYRGVMRRTAGTGAVIRYSYQVIDLLIDSPAQSGCVLSGGFCRGSVTVTGAGSNGVAVYGSNNKLEVVAANCAGYELLIAGNRNVMDVNIDGDVLLTGSDNQLRGYVSGTITVQGQGNDITGVQGYTARGRYAGTTNAAGEAAIPLGLRAYSKGFSITATVEDAGGNGSCRLASLDSSGVATFAVFANNVPVASSGVVIHWQAQAL